MAGDAPRRTGMRSHYPTDRSTRGIPWPLDWDEHKYWDHFSFDDHLIDRCQYLDYDLREWGGGGPGLGGNWYTVKSDDPAALKEELAHLMREEIPLELQRIHRKETGGTGSRRSQTSRAKCPQARTACPEKSGHRRQRARFLTIRPRMGCPELASH